MLFYPLREGFAISYLLTLYVPRNSDPSCGLGDRSLGVGALGFSAGVSVEGQKQR